MRVWTTTSTAETRALGARLVEEIGGEALVLLIGDLGTGKTVLTQGMATALGIDAAEVQSPTFTLVREHVGATGELIHIDLYRLEPEDLPTLGLEELLLRRALAVVEWADRLPWSLAADLVLSLERGSGESERVIREIAWPLAEASDGRQGV